MAIHTYFIRIRSIPMVVFARQLSWQVQWMSTHVPSESILFDGKSYQATQLADFKAIHTFPVAILAMLMGTIRLRAPCWGFKNANSHGFPGITSDMSLGERCRDVFLIILEQLLTKKCPKNWSKK